MTHSDTVIYWMKIGAQWGAKLCEINPTCTSSVSKAVTIHNIPWIDTVICPLRARQGIDSVSMALIALALRLLKQQTLLAISTLIGKALVAGTSSFSNCKVNVKCQLFLLNQQERPTRTKAQRQTNPQEKSPAIEVHPLLKTWEFGNMMLTMKGWT